MASRSFIVFQDAPAADVQSKSSKKSGSSATSSINPPQLLDKENVNPLTGERAGAQSGKKRKTAALTSKSMPLSVKLQAEVAEVKPEKKRKASSSQTAVAGKKGVRVEEEVEEEVEKKHLAQVEIDSRCYELTVQPLADVSKAYDESEAFAESSLHSKLRFVKDSSAEPELRDYVPDLKLFARATTPIESSHDTIFSTPERKRIYSAFTFSSPSPSSDRLRKMNRATSVPPLQLGDKPSYILPASSP
ncbi:hypothetical protein EYR40_010887 [Pleurotus pulmonarius]|nr:hypothetical protein EYR36_002654 [Pleurotus pulmonarius]KAF4583432.1 hypothetical protein EYR38_002183 [Pleurotus pulmonarius]KAF4586870.1 hypothetical protein EYR40_010887 [Pleurotus pulmonarius]